MKRKALGALILAMSLAAVAAAQAQEEYLDVYIARVKPEKLANAEAVTKRMVEANRRNKGDAWTTLEVVYGEQNTLYFISQRRGYADIDAGMGAFMGALNKAFGQAGAAKLFQDWNNCLAGSRGEVRRRRWDLSSNAPSDAAGRSKMMGEARWVRTNMVRVRPGRTADYEAQLRAIKAANEQSNPGVTTLVSQSSAGQQGTVFYLSALRSSMAGFDGGRPLSETLGREGYEKYLKIVSEVVLNTESLIGRLRPELSNVPAEVAAVAPAFWTPKPPMAAKPKPPAEAKGAGKQEKM